jgi:hypothetical protein
MCSALKSRSGPVGATSAARLNVRLVNERAQFVVVGHAQRAIDLERPRDREVERPPRLNARLARIGVRSSCGSSGSRVDVRPLCREEPEEIRSPL